MKLKYIIPSLMAVVALLVGCSDEFEHSYLGGLRVSSSYVAVPAEGGSADFVLNATGDWEIQNVPDWVTVSPMSGGAGETKVVVSAQATTSSNNATVKIVSGSIFQEVVISQTATKTEAVVWTVAQALAALKENPGGMSATVKGIVCKIDEISPQYGNATYYLSDDGKFGDGNWLEIYRGKWIDGASFTKGNEFAVGDELIVEGSLVLYNGATPEFTTGSSVVSITKSLIGIEKVEMLDVEEGEGVTEFAKEGGKAKITVMTKGDGFHLAIPAEAKSWLHIADFGSNYVTLEADANEGGARQTTVTLTTEADGMTYSCEQSFTQKGSIVAATVKEFLDAPVGDSQYRLTGVIKSLYASDSQGKSFTIADYSGEVLIYRAEGFVESGAKVGDVVTVVGKRGAYKESPQMISGVFEELKYSVAPVTIDEFLTKEDADNVYYMVTGVVDEIANPTYGNLYLKSGETRLYVYGCYPGWGASGDARKGCIDNYGIEVGDELTVIGVKSTFNGTPQLKNGIYFSYVAAGSE